MYVSFIAFNGDAHLLPADLAAFRHSINDGKVFAHLTAGDVVHVDHDYGILYGTLDECIEVHNAYLSEKKHEINVQVINLGKYANPKKTRHLKTTTPS